MRKDTIKSPAIIKTTLIVAGDLKNMVRDIKMISFRELSTQNISACLQLDAGSERKDFVANSFAIAWLHRHCAKPLIIYNNDNDEPVGFVLLIVNDALKVCNISRLMIDTNHQRKGYAKATLHAIFDYTRQNLACDLVRLTYAPDNIAAKKLYESVGFTANGEVDGNEIVMTFELF